MVWLGLAWPGLAWYVDIMEQNRMMLMILIAFLNSTIFCSQADLLCLHMILHEWLAFYSIFFWIFSKVVYLRHWRGWCHIKLLPSQHVLCTPYNYAPCHFMQSHIHKVHACLVVTCHQHYWQNDQDLLRATAVKQGRGSYQNKESSQKVDPGEENYPTARAGIWTCDLSIMSLVL